MERRFGRWALKISVYEQHWRGREDGERGGRRRCNGLCDRGGKVREEVLRRRGEQEAYGEK
jgi:hypothetical protein